MIKSSLKTKLLKCFNQYDIRGKVGKELNYNFAYNLGKSINSSSIIIAKDARESSNMLLNAYKDGLLKAGNNVIEIEGIATSPLLYFASLYYKTHMATMITGSHTPLEYNGFKFMCNGKALYGEQLKAILNQYNDFPKIGSLNAISCKKEYIIEITRYLKIDNSFKIAWDCNNSGLASLLKEIPITKNHLMINTTINFFKNNPPDPLVDKNLIELVNLVKSTNCKLGFATDGDGDRLVMVTNEGKILSCDQITYLLALMIKTSISNPKIIIDIKASSILKKALEDLGFQVIVASGGHSIMKQKILEENAILATETSGHFIINDGKFYPIDDALYIALRLLEYLQHNPLQELPLAKFRKELKIKMSKHSKHSFIETLKVNPDEVYKTLGGIRKDYNDGWWLIRASNSEDYILVKYEAYTDQAKNSIEKELLEIINISLSLT